ncbi:F-box/LRR-repeat protein 17 [Tanacetum coccineum]
MQGHQPHPVPHGGACVASEAYLAKRGVQAHHTIYVVRDPLLPLIKGIVDGDPQLATYRKLLTDPLTHYDVALKDVVNQICQANPPDTQMSFRLRLQIYEYMFENIQEPFPNATTTSGGAATQTPPATLCDSTITTSRDTCGGAALGKTLLGYTNSSSGRALEELGRFVADKRCLTTLKVEGCSNLGGFVLCSNKLSTLWLSDLHSLSKMVFNLPNLNEIALRFSRQENDSTDLTSMMDGLGRSCPKLQYIQIASLRLSHSVVLSLTAANLRGLRMLSLVFGPEVTDASVVAISKSYSNLELLDLSGSSISDSGIGMICNVFPDTLTKLLISQCPNITSSGIQFATAQLPLLELMDCGMTICEPDAQSPFCEANSDSDSQVSPNSKLHLIHQKLFIKHARLKKLSLWGCSSLDSLYLNCPNLSELNLNSCKALVPEKLVLQCSKLESVHAVGCPDVVVQAVQTQVSNDPAPSEDSYSRKRMADGSKRVGIPFSFSQPSPDDGKGTVRKRRCTVLVE